MLGAYRQVDDKPAAYAGAAETGRRKEKAETMTRLTKAQFCDRLMTSIKQKDEIGKLTDQQLADKLVHHVWAGLDFYTYASDLVEEAVERLGGIGESEE